MSGLWEVNLFKSNGWVGVQCGPTIDDSGRIPREVD